nr:RNA-dependent RNA polymerase [Otarine picobirnavirus]AMP18966.1 RNA-dependent RNA polymerase [Otarine picobirnavirus]
MPKNCETKFGKSFILPNQGLRSYFDNVRNGQPDVIRAPFSKKEDPQKVLKEWMPQLESLSDKWPTLVDYEKDLAKKVGPMSVMFPLEKRMDSIDNYYDDILLPSVPIDDRAVKAVISEFSKCRGLRIRNQRKTVDLMKKSTNSGSPYFTRKKRVVDETLPCEVFASDMTQSLDGDIYDLAAVLGWRGQEGGPTSDDVKQRVVWMFPFSVNIRELQLYQPLIEAFQRFNLVPAWVSMDAVDQRITKMFDTKAPDDLVVCTDFTKFDQHFNPDLQNAARTILQNLLTPDRESRTWLDQVFPVKYAIPLAYDYNKVRCGKHGMGSGSGGTNADETLVHRSLQYEAAMQANRRLNPYSQCLGDDGVLTYPGITVDDVVRTYASHGQVMNTSKQYASKHDCTYLRRWHHDQYRVDGVCVGVYSTCRALGRLMYQERFYDPEVWGPKMVALRQLSILENVKYHPLRDQFADFCMARDKYRLGIDIPGFLDNIESIAKESIENMPDFLGYTKSLQNETDPSAGISNWWIVNYLKSK